MEQTKVTMQLKSLLPAETQGAREAVTRGPTWDKARALRETYGFLQELLFLLTNQEEMAPMLGGATCSKDEPCTALESSGWN